MKKLLVFNMTLLIGQAATATTPVTGTELLLYDHRIPSTDIQFTGNSLPSSDRNRLTVTDRKPTSNTIPGTDSIPARDKDVQSIDGIIAALYDVISGPAEQKRNWDRMRTLFLPEGRLVATGIRPDGTSGKRVMNVEDYINSSGPYLEKNGFFEREIGRKTDQFGSVAHVFSTYDSKRTQADEKPFMRGINSIQLFHDGKRWWVLSVFWQPETTQLPIPEKYLP